MSGEVWSREWCFKHQVLREAGAQCGHCAAEGIVEPAPRTTLTTLPRDVLNLYDARISDLATENSYLRRRLDVIERCLRQCVPAAQNILGSDRAPQLNWYGRCATHGSWTNAAENQCPFCASVLTP